MSISLGVHRGAFFFVEIMRMCSVSFEALETLYLCYEFPQWFAFDAVFFDHVWMDTEIIKDGLTEFDAL